jgi:transposase
MDPLSQAWFFCNKQRDKLKILFWDTNGFWLYYRCLEQGHDVVGMLFRFETLYGK